jgi:hypothetical protein
MMPSDGFLRPRKAARNSLGKWGCEGLSAPFIQKNAWRAARAIK